MFHPTCLRSPAHKVLTNCKQQYCSRRHSDSVCKFCLQAKQLSQSSNWLLFFINPILTHISGVIQPRTAISLTAKGNFSKSTTRQHRTPFYLHQSLVQLSFSVQSILKRGYRKRQRFRCGDTQQFKIEDENTEKGPSTSCCDFQCHESWHWKSFICTLWGHYKDTLLILPDNYAPQISYSVLKRLIYNIIDIVRGSSENNKSNPH